MQYGDKLVITPENTAVGLLGLLSLPEVIQKATLLDLESGQRQSVGSFPGMTFAPRFSPDGQHIVMSQWEGSTSNLYAMDMRTRATAPRD